MNRAVRVMILGAAGRDFHNFNQFYRSRRGFEVGAFTAAQLHGIYPLGGLRRHLPQIDQRFQ